MSTTKNTVYGELGEFIQARCVTPSQSETHRKLYISYKENDWVN